MCPRTYSRPSQRTGIIEHTHCAALDAALCAGAGSGLQARQASYEDASPALHSPVTQVRQLCQLCQLCQVCLVPVASPKCDTGSVVLTCEGAKPACKPSRQRELSTVSPGTGRAVRWHGPFLQRAAG